MTERDIFLAALDIADPARRAVFLDRQCGSDADLRLRVDGLLVAHDAAGSFLDRPPGAATLTAAPADPNDTTGEPAGADGEEQGAVVAGRYKLVEVIGEGGMGTVWMAEQTEPTKRLVAVKVIKPGMDSKSVLARFEAERQALALMDHPNIAKVLDAGNTDRGRPFFVMELVKGIPLTAYCDDHRLTVPQRLELFVRVCAAVQHAHQKGVIHRDLKPSNVLVESHDGRPVPKVIDFGLAKALGGESLTDEPVFTRFGSVLGTPLYMAPEQAEFNARDVDTRADVYALGVILYELLTGTTPLDRKRFGRAAWDEIRRLIREEEPPRPSTRLSGSGSSPAVAAARQTEPGKLGKLVRGDLDWIAMKALAKERDRRYETPSALAGDVGRYLRDEPVTAGPPSVGYRAGKFLRRNRGPVIAAGVVLLALVGGTVGTAVGMVEARRQRDAAEASRAMEARLRTEAEDQRRQAEEQRDRAVRAEAEATANGKKAAEKAAEADSVLRFLTNSLLAAARPEGRPGGLGPEVTIRQAVEMAEKGIADQFQDQPLVEAAVRHVIGTTFQYLTEFGKARGQQARAYDIRRRLLGEEHPDTLSSLSHLARCARGSGDRLGAVELFERTLAGWTKVLGPTHPRTLQAMGDLANGYRLAGRPEKALALLEQAQGIRDEVYGPDAARLHNRLETLANVYRDLGQFDRAAGALESIVAARRKDPGPDAVLTLIAVRELADFYVQIGRLNDAWPLYTEVIDRWARALGYTHPDSRPTVRSAAQCSLRAGRPADGERFLKDWLPVCRRKHGSDSQQYANDLALTGELILAQGRPADAVGYLRPAVEILKARDTAGLHWHETRSLLGEALTGVGNFDEAEEPLRDSYRRLRGLNNNRPTFQHRQLARDALDRLIRYTEASGRLKQAAKAWRAERAALAVEPAPPSRPTR